MPDLLRENTDQVKKSPVLGIKIMANSSAGCGFVVIRKNGTPVIEKSRQESYTLVFLNSVDVNRYRQQVAELHQESKQEYAIALLPLQQLQCLLASQKVRLCLIKNWDALIAQNPIHSTCGFASCAS